MLDFRDGSAVELVGLCKSIVSWLAYINKQGHYPYSGVHVLKNGEKNVPFLIGVNLESRQYSHIHKIVGNNADVKFSDWSQLIQDNFHKYFWIGENASSVEHRPDLINRHNIYKDSYGASHEWTDYQLRSNFPVAIVVVNNV